MNHFLTMFTALLLSGSTPVEPIDVNFGAIVRVDCGASTGTAWKVSEDKYVTAYHVIDSGVCRVDGVEISDMKPSSRLDFATFTGPKSPHKIKYSCRGFTSRFEYLAVGYAFGNYFQTYQPWIASTMKQYGFRMFLGESIPGMSGGPVLDKSGRAYGIVNMRWPARSRELKDTPLCKDKK